ncbi:MAG: outer membrane protein assembly factor BamD [Chromatiales bacterium]
MSYRFSRPGFVLPGLLAAILLSSGCSLLPEEKDETLNWSANKFYTEASEAMRAGDYKTAAEYYEKLEARYPFGKYALQAQLDLAYAYYKDSEPESAIAAADRFIRLHPNHPATAYAYYLKGLVNFNRRLGFLTRFIPTDTSQRDPGAALEAYKDFAELARKFPDSEYAEDARKRMIYLRNNLAKHEVHVARYYLERGAYVAAANRAGTVVEKYQRTPAVKDALEIMIEAYKRLDKPELAQDAERVLALNLEKGTFSVDPLELEEPTLGRKIWEYLELDKN